MSNGIGQHVTTGAISAGVFVVLGAVLHQAADGGMLGLFGGANKHDVAGLHDQMRDLELAVKNKKDEPGPPGEKGDAGEDGPAGPAGTKGDKGPKGDAGVKGGAGPKGDPGAKGATGAKGDAGQNGRDAQIPAGALLAFFGPGDCPAGGWSAFQPPQGGNGLRYCRKE